MKKILFVFCFALMGGILFASEIAFSDLSYGDKVAKILADPHKLEAYYKSFIADEIQGIPNTPEMKESYRLTFNALLTEFKANVAAIEIIPAVE